MIGVLTSPGQNERPNLRDDFERFFAAAGGLIS